MDISTFSDWLKGYLTKLSTNIDSDVFGDYIIGLLDESLDEEDKCETVSEFLASTLSLQIAASVSHEIVSKYTEMLSARTAGISAAGNVCAADGVDEVVAAMTAEMRRLTQSERQPAPDEHRLRERDPVTAAALRLAGAAGYQANAESEAAMEISSVNAEFVARQRLLAASTGAGCLAFLPTSETEEGADLEVIDIAELEDAAGYGKKNGIKPGTAEGALALLAPDRFGGSLSHTGRGGRTAKRLATPGDVSTARLATAASPLCGQAPAGLPSGVRAASPEVRKRPPGQTSAGRRLTEVGARAELRHARMLARRNEKLADIPVAGRGRLDDMDAFFASDDEADQQDGPTGDGLSQLPEGGRNHERVLKAAKAFRDSERLAHAEKRAADKLAHTQKLAADSARKQTAQERTRKQERRRR